MKTNIVQAKPCRWPLVGAFSIAVWLLVASVAVAEEDHLLGYKVKSLDKLKPQTTHVVSNQFGTSDCELKGTAKFFLVKSEKDGGDDPRGGSAGDFACYKAKCSGPLPPDTQVDHQLGEETYESKKVQILCLPVEQALSCPGELIGGFCWVLGAAGASCDATCALLGAGCDPATISYAGSGGTSANCQAVSAALGASGFLGDSPCLSGVGCLIDTTLGSGLHCTSPATSCEAAEALAKRACACQ